MRQVVKLIQLQLHHDCIAARQCCEGMADFVDRNISQVLRAVRFGIRHAFPSSFFGEAANPEKPSWGLADKGGLLVHDLTLGC
jgi:hypothetical protein